MRETPQNDLNDYAPKSLIDDSANQSWHNKDSRGKFSVAGLPPKPILFLLIFSIFFGAFIVHFFLHFWMGLPDISEALVDAIILVLVLTPTFIYFHYRPMVHNLRQRDTTMGQLAESEERLNLALEAVNDGLWDWNVQTGEVYFTPRFATMLGYHPDELEQTSDSLKALVHAEDQDLFEHQISESLMRQGKDIEIELRLKCRSASPAWLWVQVRGKVVERGTDGSPLRALGTNTNIQKRKQTESALQQSEEGIRFLSRQLINNSEAEKKHLAQELHDDFGQMINAFEMGIEMIRSLNSGKHPEVEFHCARLLEIGKRMDGSLHEICDNLRPAILDDLGLFRTLEWLIEQFSEQHGDIQTRIELPEIDMRLPEEIELVCYRVCQETLHNISKHARATAMDLALTVSDNNIQLYFSDNGCGFDAARRKNKQHWGIGLLGIKERASALGGTATIESSPGNGTRISVVLPLANKE